MSDSYLYYQVQGGEEAWTPCPLRFAPDVRKKEKPVFMTVLAVNEVVDAHPTPEVLERLKHSGPFYMDWDSGEDINLAIEDTRQTLITLVEKHQLDHRCLEIYATGGKGFHLIVPHEVFMQKMPPAGIKDLHKIYKGMAYALATDTLDFRVYSGRRGRMWREPNIQRSNGRYKVPITYDELMVMDEEMYIDLTSQPRYYAEPDSIAAGDKRYVPQPIKAVPCLGLTIIFDKSKTEVETSNKRKRNKANDVKALAKWGDQPPPSFRMILEGKGLRKGQGFNAIALQVVITAQELGWSLDKLLENSKGLCEAHVSDGRHNSFAKRQSELARLYEYCNDYIYEFSVPGLRSLIEFESPDLDGVVSEAIKAEVEKAAKAADAGETVSKTVEGDDLTRAIELRPEGIYVIDEDARKSVSTIAFKNPKVRVSATTGKLQEIEAEIYSDGKRTGSEVIPLNVFESKHLLNKFAQSWGSVFFGTDQNASSIMRKLRLNALQGKEGKIIHTVPREGLDWVCLPNHENEELRKLFPVFVDPRGVHLPQRIAETGVELGYSSDFAPGGIYQSDLMRAPEVMEYVQEHPQSVEILRGLFTCQKKKVLSKILGWYCAAYYRMFFDKASKYGKFPLLHVFGQAGSGKTEMNELMLRFHYHMAEPRVLTPSSSLYALRINVTASASIPLVIDEYKVSDMKDKYYPLSNMLKAAYNNREFQMGGGNSDSADKRSLSSANLSAPIVYISEACEEMTALQERSIMIPVSRAPEPLNSVWRKRFETAKGNYEILSALGRYMCTNICNLSLDEFVQAFDPIKDEAERVLLAQEGEDGSPSIQRQSREAFNYAVVKFGLLSLQKACQNVFGDALDKELNDLIEEVYTGVTDSAVRVMSEINKFINSLSQMAQVHDQYSPAHLAKGIHYEVFEYAGKNALEINLTACVDRYLRDNQAKGLTPLFKDANIIMGSLKEHAGLLKDKPEKLSAHCNRGVVLDLDYIISQGIEPFPDN